MRILGIDPGTGRLGFGVIDFEDNKMSLVDAGVITTPAKQEDSRRLKTIHEDLENIVKTHKPTVMAVEKLYFSQNVTTAMSVAQARGIVLLLGETHGLKLYEHTPQQIKQAISGYGKATKEQVQEMVRMMLKLKEVPKPDDAADALACAITCSMSMS